MEDPGEENRSTIHVEIETPSNLMKSVVVYVFMNENITLCLIEKEREKGSVCTLGVCMCVRVRVYDFFFVCVWFSYLHGFVLSELCLCFCVVG